jgi:hypothetical protein
MLKKQAATKCGNFELSAAGDITKWDFMNKMPFKLTPVQGSY